MKRYIDILVAGCLLFLSGGCSEETGKGIEMPDNTQMTFDIIHPAMQQKANVRATAEAFENNDRIGLFVTAADAPLEVSGNYVNNAALTYNGAAWTPDNPIYWNDGTYNVYAYYPYSTPVVSVDDAPFTVATDQSVSGSGATLGGYEASDFLWAGHTKVSADGKPVSLLFKHRMSKLLIRLVKGEDYEGELPDEAEVYIHNTIPSATIDLSVGIVTKNPHATSQTIKAKALGNQRYTAIVVPQRLDNRQPLVEVVMKGVSYLYESKFLFKPGIQHIVSLIITKNPEQVKIEIGGEVENWE